MSMPVSGVLFDIGGVLVSLDGVPSLSRLLGIDDSRENIHRRWLACPSVILHETGKLTSEEFAREFVNDMELAISPESFLAEFDAWLTGVHPGAFELVNEIPGRYRVAALSNMSATHWHRIRNTGWPKRFEAVFVSCETGLLKPGAEAFEAALRGMELPAAEILFLDDSEYNVHAARTLGMHAHVVNSPTEARAVLERYGVFATSP